MAFQITNDNLLISATLPVLQKTFVTLGDSAGENRTGFFSIAIGDNSGQYTQGENSIAIGKQSGQYNQGQNSIAIGENSGQYTQGQNSIAIGKNSGENFQGIHSISIGTSAGENTQGSDSIAIGNNSAKNNQGINAISIGNSAGENTQGSNAIAIGNQAGQYSQGTNSIAIGNLAGQTQHDNSIILNASGSVLNSYTQNSFYVNPIRLTAGTNPSGLVFYNLSTKELTYDSTKSFIIYHPIDSSRYLVHACLEGPEAGVYYRGKSEITNDESVEILLPEYTKAFSDFTVQISSNNKNTYCSSEVENGKFTVYGKNGKFFWMVNALRDSIDTEPLKVETEVRGIGPYKYLIN